MPQFSIVTGASRGIGLELARCCAEAGPNLILIADTPLDKVEAELGSLGTRIESLEADLSTEDGVDALLNRIGNRAVDNLLANAGHGLGRAFVEQDWQDVRHVIGTNVTGTMYLAHNIGREMEARGKGRILFTGSIDGFMPGTFQAVYNASKAFVDSFAVALRHELQDAGVSVTVLMPGPTDTEFFERAGMVDTKVGQGSKSDPAEVAQVGFKAMMNGNEAAVPGLMNKLQVAMSGVVSESRKAEQHRKMAEPGSADN